MIKNVLNKRLLLPALALMAAANTAHADDYGVWTELTVQKSLSKQWSVDAGIDLRAENKLKDFTRYGVSVGVGYKPCSYVSLGAGYNFLRDYNLEETKYEYRTSGALKNCKVDDAFWRSKHRATFDVTGSLPVGRFTLSVRERYQYTHFVATTTLRSVYKSPLSAVDLAGYTGPVYECGGNKFATLEVDPERPKAAKDRHYLRSRFGVEYNIRHCAWTPYLTYEFSNDMSNQLHLDKQRLTVGTEWKITKQHRLDIAYVYSNGADDDNDSDIHVLSLGYKFKF